MTDNALGMDCVWESGCEPYRAHDWDAGLDLRASETTVVREGETVMVGTGFSCHVPEGYVGLLAARSSLSRRDLLLANGVGVIDSGYTGEVRAPIRLVSRSRGEFARTETIEAGERIVQLLVVPCARAVPVQVRRLGDTERGDGGFGSSGR